MNSYSKYFAEALGAFALVFAGTSAIVVNSTHGGVIGHAGIAAVFGLVVAALIYALGDLSGAHFNPAVTIGFWLARRFPGREVTPYILSQCAGAIVASVIVRLLFGNVAALGATLPSGSLGQSLVLEVILTFFLMFVIIRVATGAKEMGVMAGAAIGATVWLDALFGGPVSGASMNPARSLAPALISGQLGTLWIYLLAPVLGAVAAIGACRCLRDRECCG